MCAMRGPGVHKLPLHTSPVSQFALVSHDCGQDCGTWCPPCHWRPPVQSRIVTASSCPATICVGVPPLSSGWTCGHAGGGAMHAQRYCGTVVVLPLPD